MKPADRRPALDVHHVRHLLFSCTTVLGLTLAGGCDNGAATNGATDGNGGETTPSTDTGAPEGTATGESNDGETENGAGETGGGDSTAAGNGSGASTPADPTVNASPAALPKHCYIDDTQDWIGQDWRTTQLFTLMPTWPKDLDDGTRYVIFYNRTCDHCRELFYEHLAVDPEFASTVAAIEIPEETGLMTAENAWPLPDGLACEMLALPLGPNYIITSPVAMRIENGVVTCATEGEHEACLDLTP